MRVIAASDHAGVMLRPEIVAQLRDDGHTVDDLGTFTGESTDYPDWAERVAREIAAGGADMGVLICGTGVGMSIAANKVPGVRAAAVSDPVSAQLARSHNDANVVCLGARIVGPEVAAAIVRAFVGTPFSGGERHVRRVAKLGALDHAREARIGE